MQWYLFCLFRIPFIDNCLTNPSDFVCFLNIYLLGCTVFSCGVWDLFPWPGSEPWPPALGAQSFNHWTTRKIQSFLFCFASLIELPECSRNSIVIKCPCGHTVCTLAHLLRSVCFYLFLSACLYYNVLKILPSVLPDRYYHYPLYR